ncbi:apoptotic protease-activating factor 1 [Drosophila virilis]|uniref:Uncharacterized protein, isoform A n=1 Tax=Drosophila virilis TaxID=7244 RepID=B4MCL0_DROVI|nr:uncharacterized protein LOC6635408 [Drosophila virilis]XP_032293208.1 uncharacterized protein LOC6635408 [Drosophila virilis]EDW71398.1 uncharacterized protein Dvir_GJ19684, isoform A [Drosophila virilis]KRF85692.1 uncharacterized protein Dvir_GJ19684, isoform C [Drosophila virilis]
MSCCNSVNEQHSYGDIIPVFLEDFKKDFDCKDIEDILRIILKKKEVDDIVKMPHPLQTYRLFWTLRNQRKETVKKFVEEGLKDSHGPNYGFLMSAIQKECIDPSLNTETYIQEVDRLYNDNQEFTKYNVPRIEPYLELQKALLELRPSKNVVVEGDLGAGKQWLVLDVCSSYVVQRKMDFKIFWLDVRSCLCPESRLEMLQSFLYQIAPNLCSYCNQSVPLRIESVQTQLRNILKNKSYKNCLLVLRNVQNKETWQAFNLGCKILLTSRDKSVVNFLSPVTTTHVTVNDVLTLSEMESLFAKYLSENQDDSVEDLTVALYRQQIRNPLQLSVIAESIQDGLCTIDNWKQINSAKLTTIIKTSLNVLEPKDRQLYEALFIFPDSAHIPIQLLGAVWSVTDPIHVVNKLNKYFLVKKHKDKQNRLTITLPSIYRELKLPIKNEAALNRRIIDYYNIPQVFDSYNGLTLPHLDNYFYSHIGDHLSKLNNSLEKKSLFRKIFLDFRFLDQKIRNDSTPWNARGSVLHTLQVLRFYGEQIADNDLLCTLMDFLLNAEEKLIRSEFTCLLQIALMTAEGALYDEAYRQAQLFPNYVWFTERGRFNQHRQIINLGDNQVRHAIYLDNDYCLMALSNQQLLLTDVSLEGDMTYLLSDENNPCDIIEMRVFNNQSHLLTLYSNGCLKLWSLQQLLHRSCGCERPQLAQPPKHSKSFCNVQFVNSAVQRLTNTHADQNVSSFFLDEKDEVENNFIQLHVAFTNGDICICDWDKKEEKFKQSHTPILKTQQRHVKCFSKVLDRYYVLCTDDCTLTVWDLLRGSKETEQLFQTEEALTMQTYIDRFDDGSLHTMLLLIFKSSVWRLRFKQADRNTINPLNQEALKFSDIGAVSITCGRLSKDGRYLVLGTLEGLIVYDLKFSEPVLRSNVSEHIVCLDVYDLNDPILKYIVLCGAAGKNVLHLHTLRNVPGIDKHAITWIHNANREQFEPNVYLRPLLKMIDDGTLFIVDSKSRIYQIPTELVKKHSGAYWSTISTPPMHGHNHITALHVSKNKTIYAGYNNGKIFNITENKELLHEYTIENIDYIKKINSNILIVSSRSKCITLIFDLSILEGKTTLTSIWAVNFGIYTKYARLFDEHFLLIFSEEGIFYIDLLNPKLQHFDELNGHLVGFDLKDNLLYLAFRDGTIKICELSTTTDKVYCQLLCNENIISQSIINDLTVTNDGKIVSIGFYNGHIKIYTYEKFRLQHIYTISQGHEACHVMKLRFSPCKQILVSCAEQLCFWNVQHMLNNRVTSYRRNMRFRQGQSQCYAEAREEVDAAPCLDLSEDQKDAKPLMPLDGHKHADKSKAHLWRDKQGNAKLPELLACIKYVGNVARHFYASGDFTQFFALDDEGVFYHLKVLEFSSPQSKQAIAATQLLREIDHQTSINQTEMPIPRIDEMDRQDDDGIDVVGNSPLFPFTSAATSQIDYEPNVI